MDTRLLAAWLVLCQLCAMYKPCSTRPDSLRTIGDVSNKDISRLEGNPDVVNPTQLPDSTSEGSSSPGEHRGVSDDPSYGHRQGSCCQHGYAGRHHSRMMGLEYGHRMGRYHGYMEGRLNRRMMGRRNEDTMGQHHGEMGPSNMYDRDHMQGGSQDGTREADQNGSNEEDFQTMMGNGQYGMMEDRYGMSRGVDNTRGARHRGHRRRHGQRIPDKNND